MAALRDPITKEHLRIWSGYIDCHWGRQTCCADAVCFIEGNPYCEAHALEIEHMVEEVRGKHG